MERRRNLGLVGGCLWLVLVGAAFAVISLLVVRSPEATALLTAISLIAAALILLGIARLRAVLRLPNASPPRPGEARRLARRFGVVAALECIALTAVNLFCVFHHRWALIAPLDLIVVGLHFLPLARLFHVPRYYIAGALFCIVPILTMLLVPADRLAGSALVWFVVPSVGCAAIAFVTSWAGLREAGRYIHASRMRA